MPLCLLAAARIEKSLQAKNCGVKSIASLVWLVCGCHDYQWQMPKCQCVWRLYGLHTKHNLSRQIGRNESVDWNLVRRTSIAIQCIKSYRIPVVRSQTQPTDKRDRQQNNKLRNNRVLHKSEAKLLLNGARTVDICTFWTEMCIAGASSYEILFIALAIYFMYEIILVRWANVCAVRMVALKRLEFHCFV